MLQSMIEAAINALASRQHGVLTREQLLDAGVNEDVIDRRLRTGRLRAVHRGVYAAGPTAVPRAREMAACLACGTSAVVSQRTASALWGFLSSTSTSAPVEITLAQGRRRRPGIRIRRMRDLRCDEVTHLDGIPITTPARTLLDLAAAVGSRELERALARALAQGLTTVEELDLLVRRHSRHRGSSVLRELLSAGEPAITRSEAEERFLALVRKTSLPPPGVNVGAAGYEVDFLWRAERVVVEIDGQAYHSLSPAFERDRLRDATLAAAGYRVLRITWKRLLEEPEAVLVDVARAIATPVTGVISPPLSMQKPAAVRSRSDRSRGPVRDGR